ncbi:MAG: hypothetical protein IJU95_07150 [Treponema sp.]|nr:hypothetical protein [Treponema sp.]
MFCWKKALAAIVISSSILALPLICASCDDSASSSDEEIEQVEAKDKGSRDEINDLRSKYDWSLPENWIRSHTYYSADNVNGYDADVINFTFQQNWQGKNLYLARNFKKENGEILVNGDIIFYFDDKLENSDGYYIYYNKLPLDN